MHKLVVSALHSAVVKRLAILAVLFMAFAAPALADNPINVNVNVDGSDIVVTGADAGSVVTLLDACGNTLATQTATAGVAVRFASLADGIYFVALGGTPLRLRLDVGDIAAATPCYDASEWVDLGLPSGLLWCTHNVGATNPEDYGDYFAWGETTPKSDYSWSTYAYGNAENQMTKYCSVASYGLNGFTDNLTTLEPGDDAATANMGGGARTPTLDEWNELLSNTTAEWITLNGVHGRLLISTINDNTLFLPAAGDRYGTVIGNAYLIGYYWSASLDSDNPYKARAFDFHSGYQYVDGYYGRSDGLSVRAVRSAQ